MTRMTRRGPLALLAAGLLVAAAFGCGGPEIRFAAPPQAILQGGVNVTFQRAEADDDSLMVRFYITNISDQIMMVNRDGFGLRLPSGQVLQRRGMNQQPYQIAPGQGHEVWVKFEEEGLHLNALQAASVIVGGISYGNDPVPRVVGEIPITAAGEVD